jgi:DnaJ-class molecular chaperone
VDVKIEVPEVLSEEEQRVMEEFAAASGLRH